MPETHLWRLIESWRKRQRFAVSQAALARDIGVERSAVSQWKWGQATPSPDNLRAIQAATGIRYRDLTDALLMDQGYLRPAGDRDGASTQEEAQTTQAPGSGAMPSDDEISDEYGDDGGDQSSVGRRHRKEHDEPGEGLAGPGTDESS